MKPEPCGSAAATAAALLTWILASLGSIVCPPTAGAAFLLREASPELLGTASVDLGFDPLAGTTVGGGARLAASRASLYDVPGLAADRLSGGCWLGSGWLEGSWCRIGTPDLSETTLGLAWRETGPRAVLLHGRAEALVFTVMGEERSVGWAAGAGVTGQFQTGRVRTDLLLDADRILRGTGAEGMGVEPAVSFGFRIRLGGAAVCALDRWERSGRRSPRIALQLPMGSMAALRVGRGGNPGRLGVALLVRWRSLSLSAGRLDDSAGGVITAAGLRLLFGSAGRPGP